MQEADNTYNENHNGNFNIPPCDIELYPQQQQAVEEVRDFLQSDTSVFILKGYAGTGKTTIVKALLPIIGQMGRCVTLLAPTGRAAKVLQQKTHCCTHTIHRAIYSLKNTFKKKVETDEDAEQNDASKKDEVLGFWFKLRQFPYDTWEPRQRVFIVDEASMISAKKTAQELLHFGTDILLEDLLTYAKLDEGAKIIFIGDPAQLPPVGDSYSAALDSDYFTARHLTVKDFTLTNVVRQAADSAILQNATTIRETLYSPVKNELSFNLKENEVEALSSEDIVSKYIELFPKPTLGKSAVICYSNATALHYNEAIRSHYFPHCKDVQPGDVLQIVKNCIVQDKENSAPYHLYNGDFATVLQVAAEPEKQTAPVWMTINGKRVQQPVTLEFRDVTLQAEGGLVFSTKIIETLLKSASPSLDKQELTSLYINFVMRNNQLRNSPEIQGEILLNDPYFNALNVKYGYAITGHKSQGSDWDVAFVDYSKRSGLFDEALRWMYTTTTRAKKTLYGVNIPQIYPLAKLEIREISKIAKPAANALSLANIAGTDLLPHNAANHQKAKCLSVTDSLKEFGASVTRIELLSYKDRYYINTLNGEERYDCIYNGAGHYTTYTPLGANYDKQILQALHSEKHYIYSFSYIPSAKALANLYHKVMSACNELDITITNIVEETKQYYVLYFLKTSGNFSQIKFYYNKNLFITYGQPSSDLGAEDTLLQELINNLR